MAGTLRALRHRIRTGPRPAGKTSRMTPSHPDLARGEEMTNHRTGTREEWLAARLELLDAEKELTRRGDELARKRQELTGVRVDKEYRFETDAGDASLAD